MGGEGNCFFRMSCTYVKSILGKKSLNEMTFSMIVGTE